MKFAAVALVAFFCLTATPNVVESRGIQNRIISGTPAARNQFPWQVILKKNEMDELHCGGSIIDDYWVLTAAHCAYGLSTLNLIFGTNQLNDDDGISMTSTQLFIHPQYNNDNLNNDLALVRLPQALNFGASIQPIALVSATQANNDFLGTVAIIAGFGLTDDEYLEFSQQLLYAQVKIINNSECLAFFGSSYVIDSTMCAKGANGSNMSICSGDSGGPLIVRNANGDYMQIGINSFVAEDSCTEGYPSGYVRLAMFKDFIANITGISGN